MRNSYIDTLSGEVLARYKDMTGCDTDIALSIDNMALADGRLTIAVPHFTLRASRGKNCT